MKPLRLLLLLLLVAAVASSATLPGGFVERRIAGLTNPTAMALAPDGRIFICEQGGQLRVVKNGALLAEPFLTVTVSSSGERGLLGVTFDPQFAQNRWVYVYYTATTPNIHNRVSRFTANGDVAEPGSEVVLMDLEPLSATNHNGGAIHFGSDGKLYVAVGENAVGSNSQTLSNRLGKMLRIDSDGSIPPDNPFYSTATGENRAIWALGLRNPFTFAFQRGTGRMLINDVGQSTWEEINDGLAGANYGWPDTEGPTSDPDFVSPLFSYGRGDGPTTGCAITGGAFYDSLRRPFGAGFAGKYFFADYCSDWIRVLDPNTATASAFAAGANAPVDLRVGPDGSLYYLARGNGSVYRVMRPVPVADFEGNGRDDLVWRNEANGSNALWLLNGTAYAGGTALPAVTDANWRIAGTGDFDLDGMVDLVWRNASTGENAIWFMNGTGYREGVRFSTVADTEWSIVAVSDFDLDGDPDLLWRHGISGDNALWLMDGAALEGTASILRVADTSWKIAGAGDFNFDGRADIVWRNAATGENAIWFMNGAAYLSGTRIPGVADPNWEIGAVADFDLDGNPDLAWRNYETGANAIWRMNGADYEQGVSLPAVTSPEWRLAGPR